MNENVDKKAQKDKIGDALEALDRLTIRGQNLIGQLLNGAVDSKDTLSPSPSPENGVIFDSLWQELADRILKRVNVLNNIFSELDKMLLK